MQLFKPLLCLGFAAVGLAQAPPEFGGLAGTCGETCVNGVLAKAATYGCAGPQDTACICTKVDFHNGVRDCSGKTCAAELQGLVTEYVNNKLCVGIPSPAVDKAADATTLTTTPITLPAPSPTTTEPAPTTTSAIVSSETTSSAQPSTVQSSASSATSSASVSSSSLISSSVSSTSPERTQSASQSSTNAASSTAAPTSTSSPSPTAVPAASGLSLESRIGLGVGTAAAGMALIGLVACLVVSRRRKAANAKTHTTVMQKLKISDPISGGRTFANDPRHRQYETGENELETRSKRYEEYEPRVSPRNMV